MQHANQPDEILFDHRLIKPVLLLDEFQLRRINGLTLALQLVHISCEIVTGRQLDNDENQSADHDQRWNHHQNPAGHIAEH